MACAHSFGDWCRDCIDTLVIQYNDIKQKLESAKSDCIALTSENGLLRVRAQTAEAEIERLKADLEYQIADKDMVLDQKKLADLQVREVWDLLTSMPSGPGEGMDSDAEGMKAQAEWNERFRAMEAKLGKGAETRVESSKPRFCMKCGAKGPDGKAHPSSCVGKGDATHPAEPHDCVGVRFCAVCNVRL